MTTLPEPDIEHVAAVLTRVSRDTLCREVPSDEISTIVREVLHGEKDLWRAFLANLVTRREVASALLAHVQTRMIDRLGLPWEAAVAPTDYDPISETERALFPVSIETRDEPRVAEFGVAGLESSPDGVVVIGRCHRGPLKKGDVFRRALSSTNDPHAHLPVELTVEEITAYGRQLTRLDEGLTARLRLIGRVTGTIPDRSVLSTR